MDNDILHQILGKLDKLEQGQAKMQEDIEIIKEDVEITRVGTNTLLDWAERVEKIVNVPLVKN